MNIDARADVGLRHANSGFEQLPIGGEWRRGRVNTALRNLDAYMGKVILEIPQADSGPGIRRGMP
jgi:hypothetical protein